MNENWKSEAERDAGHKYKYEYRYKDKDWKRRLSGVQATNTNTYTKNENEILKPDMPEILKLTFLEEKFKNEFLVSAGEAPATTAEEPDERRKLVRVEVPSRTVSRREVPNRRSSATSSTTTKGWKTER